MSNLLKGCEEDVAESIDLLAAEWMCLACSSRDPNPGQHGADRVLQPLVGIGDQKGHPGKATGDEAPQKTPSHTLWNKASSER